MALGLRIIRKIHFFEIKILWSAQLFELGVRSEGNDDVVYEKEAGEPASTMILCF